MIKSLILNVSKGIIPLLIFFKTYGQNNLVPNYDFENYTSCPNGSISGPQTFPWLNLITNRSTYFNACANPTPIGSIFGVPYNLAGATSTISNYQIAHSGYGYLVFVAHNTDTSNGSNRRGAKRNYQAVKLTDSLKKNKKYLCGFNVALSNGANYGINNIGMNIINQQPVIDTSVAKDWVINTNPQVYNYNNPIIKDTQNWTLVQSIFIAKGGENYITIGNFKKNDSTNMFRYLSKSATEPDWAVYMLDDVFVYELNNSYCATANAGRDTTIKQGDSVFIGSLTNGIDSIKWLQNGLIPIDSSRPGFWVKPTTAGTYMYIVQQTVNGCTSADTVWVNVNSLPLKFISYSVISKVVRNLEKSVENLWQTANEINVSHYNIERSTNAKDFTTIGKVKANNKAANEYNFTDLLTTNYSLLTTLYYRVVGVDFDGKKTYSEVRQLAMGKEQLAISIFPNPAKDVVHIAGDNIQQIVISTIEGKRILNSTLKKIDVGNLPKGVYITSVYTTKGNIKNEKLIVY